MISAEKVKDNEMQSERKTSEPAQRSPQCK